MAWLPVLLFAEVMYPRLHYDLLRWSTVFPVGMYAACSFVAGSVWPSSAAADFASCWVWVAVAVWTIVFVAMTRRAIGALRDVRGRALAL